MASESSPEVMPTIVDVEDNKPFDIYEILSVSQKKWVLLMVSMVALITPFTDTVISSHVS